jgi:hypothetical protein
MMSEMSVASAPMIDPNLSAVLSQSTIAQHSRRYVTIEGPANVLATRADRAVAGTVRDIDPFPVAWLEPLTPLRIGDPTGERVGTEPASKIETRVGQILRDSSSPLGGEVIISSGWDVQVLGRRPSR